MTRPTLIAAVLADPDALLAVLAADFKVAASWQRGPTYAVADGHSEREGRSSDDTSTWRVAFVNPVVRCENGHVPRREDDTFCATCGKRVNVRMFNANAGGRVTTLASREEGEAWCDEQLRKAGWLLATGEST